MGNNHLKKSLIPKSSISKSTKYINKDAALLEGIQKEGYNANVFISVKHLQHSYQCFSDWTKVEMNDFWNFNNELHEKTWQDVYASARKSDKTGLAYTLIPYKKYPESDFKKKLSKDITLFELRVNQKIRVHGFRVKAIFYLCWLDRNHEIAN